MRVITLPWEYQLWVLGQSEREGLEREERTYAEQEECIWGPGSGFPRILSH